MRDLVRQLSQGDHPVVFSSRPTATVEAFQKSIERGYVHIKFTDTQGGTELGVRLNSELSDLKGADFANQSGSVKLVGELTLDYVKARCTADIALPTLEGKGRLIEVHPQ